MTSQNLNRIVSYVFCVLGLAIASPGNAGVVLYVAPAGGLTIKNVISLPFGQSGIVLNEATPELDQCASWTWETATYTKPLWIVMNNPNDPTAKQVYATAVAASLAGKKLTGIWVYKEVGISQCNVVGLTVAP